MKKLSYWSKRNPISARLLIALGHIIMGALGIISGIAAYIDDFIIPTRILYLLFIVFAFAYIFYPLRGRKTGLLKYSWNRRVKHDFIIVLSYTCILTTGVNQFAFQPIASQEPQLEVRLMIFKPGGETSTITRKETRNVIRETVKEFRTQIKTQLKSLKAEWKETKENKGGLVALKIFLVLLALVLALLVASGIGALACELSCAGQEGLAWIVLLVGTAGLLLLTIVGIRAIVRIGNEPVIHPDKDEKVIVKRES